MLHGAQCLAMYNKQLCWSVCVVTQQWQDSVLADCSQWTRLGIVQFAEPSETYALHSQHQVLNTWVSKRTCNHTY